jgi:hypothetical protein
VVDEFRILQDRIERLEPGVGDVRDRLRHCLRVAERPQDAIALARSVGENLAKRLLEGIGIKQPAMLDACLKELERPEVMSRNLVPSEIITILHMVRVMGNKATHDSMRVEPAKADVFLVLQSILRVVEWYFHAFERGPKLERVFGAATDVGHDQGAAPGPGARASGAAVSTRRKAAYEQLWQRVEEIHLKIRTEEVEGEVFSLLLRGINTYIFQNSLYFDDAVHGLTNNYLLLLMDIRRVVTEAGDEEASRALADTADIPPSAIRRVLRLQELVEGAERVRTELLGKVRAILEEPSERNSRRRRRWFW